MVYKIFKKNNYIVVVDDRNFYHEEHCSAVLVLKRLSTDSSYDIIFVRPDNVPQAFYSVPFADIRDEFNAPYASIAVWETWYTTNTGCQGGSGSDAILLSIDSEVTSLNTPVAVVAVAFRSSTSSSVAAGKRSVAIFNAGNANGTVTAALTDLLPGESISFSAGDLRDTLTAIDYDATGTDFLITTVG